jgi:tRNA pseudouridine38-40 synthase
MGKKLEEYAEKMNDVEEYRQRQAEVADFWPGVEEKYIKPILHSLDDSLRPLVEEALYNIEASDAPEGADPVIDAAYENPSKKTTAPVEGFQDKMDVDNAPTSATGGNLDAEVQQAVNDLQKQEPDLVMNDHTDGTVPLPDSEVDKSALEAAVKALKKAYMDAKKAYRIDPKRQARVQAALNQYLGTHRFHNYTVQKKFNDGSAKRYIKSFNVAAKPIIINDTEWLSLKVHGQSFMMHQIRKMVGMAALTVRSGTNPEIFETSFGNNTVRIPKAPGLGLLLERPVFDSYNEKQAKAAGRDNIDFSKYEKQIAEFKEREIYQRIFREEAEGNQ